ncbi:MAG: betaine/proline/choline family ABC transporter ATP-binding protein [Acidimicrobiaceae bacterium]|nr:betaine/proline/choline family ABC transporter ATP-binding protein [Acidimicrobiaceae bacterium]
MEKSQVQISCKNLWKVFGPKGASLVGSPDASLPPADLQEKTGCVVAIRDVSFEVARGEVFVVMGLSGSGKSTLIRSLTRLVDVDAGEIELCQRDVRKADKNQLRDIRRHNVSMVFQQFALFPHRRVVDNVAFGLEIQGVKKADRYRKVDELLQIVGLSGFANSFPSELSGGMQQRVGLARALAVDPEVLLFDEAFSALDPLIRREMQDQVIHLQEQLHKTVVFVSHDLDEALKLGDRIAIMRNGAFVQVGTPEEVVGAPKDGYVAAFTRDVSRSKVLTARWAMQTPKYGNLSSYEDRIVSPTTLLQGVLPVVLASELPVGVVDTNGRLIGELDRRSVLAAINDGPSDAEVNENHLVPAAANWREEVAK